MTLAASVLHEDDLASAYHALLAVAGRYFHARIKVDDVRTNRALRALRTLRAARIIYLLPDYLQQCARRW
jgi:hypothetical protein